MRIAGTAVAYVDKVLVAMSIVTAATTGTVDHSRSDVSVLGSLSLLEIGDLLIGTGLPPGVDAFYSGNDLIDPSAIPADIKVIGGPSAWNAGPGNGFTVNGLFEAP